MERWHLSWIWWVNKMARPLWEGRPKRRGWNRGSRGVVGQRSETELTA